LLEDPPVKEGAGVPEEEKKEGDEEAEKPPRKEI